MHSNRARLLNRTTTVNKKIKAINSSIDVKDIHSNEAFNDLKKANPHFEQIKGYYIELPLDQVKIFVPDAEQFPDRDGSPYVKEVHGQFNAPLLTLTEWHKGFPRSSRPDLLINANWFNVWESGIPFQGKKMDLRKEKRSYSIGLSVSEGKVISSHQTLDQDNVPLDSIIFDSQRKNATLMSVNEIDVVCEQQPQYFNRKNAVSGFILVKDGKLRETPKINNNHNNRLPRTGIGLKEDNKTAVIIVIHNQSWKMGVSAPEFASFFELFGCYNVINLDNSGSVELCYFGTDSFGKQMTIKTQTCDVGDRSDALSPNLSERPKPNCIGFKWIGKKARFFAFDDSDCTRHSKLKPLNDSVSKSNIKYI